jgi:hypothetical protein
MSFNFSLRLLVIPLGILALFVCNTRTVGSARVPDTVAVIRRECRVIDGHLRRDRKVDKDVETGTDGGGGVTAYFAGSRLEKLVVFVGLSTYNREDSFYYDRQRRLIAVVCTKSDFYYDAAKQELDLTRYGKVTKSAYYFPTPGLRNVVIYSSGKEEAVNADAKREISDLLEEARGCAKLVR